MIAGGIAILGGGYPGGAVGSGTGGIPMGPPGTGRLDPY